MFLWFPEFNTPIGGDYTIKHRSDQLQYLILICILCNYVLLYWYIWKFRIGQFLLKPQFCIYLALLFCLIYTYKTEKFGGLQIVNVLSPMKKVSTSLSMLDFIE